MDFLLTKDFNKDFDKLPGKIKFKIKTFIEDVELKSNFSELSNNNIKKLKDKSSNNYYRLRIGDYRIGFRVDIVNNEDIILFLVAKSRGEIYKKFPPKN